MAASARSILKRAGEFFQNLEKKKLIRLIVLAAVIVAAGIIGAVLLNQVKYTVLFSGLDPEEAGTIKTVLDEKSVPAKVQGTSTILVPEKQADELRIELASEGYPSTGLNYELFTNAASPAPRTWRGGLICSTSPGEYPQGAPDDGEGAGQHRHGQPHVGLLLRVVRESVEASAADAQAETGRRSQTRKRGQ